MITIEAGSTKIELPTTQGEVLKLYAGDGYYDRQKDFSDIITERGLYIGGSHGLLRRAPYRAVKKPIGPFVQVVKGKRGLFAAFKHANDANHKRDVALRDFGGVMYLLRACAVEVVRDSGNSILAANLEELKKAAQRLLIAEEESDPSRTKPPVQPPELRKTFPVLAKK